jgi:hypothetical protein
MYDSIFLLIVLLVFQLCFDDRLPLAFLLDAILDHAVQILDPRNPIYLVCEVHRIPKQLCESNLDAPTL